MGRTVRPARLVVVVVVFGVIGATALAARGDDGERFARLSKTTFERLMKEAKVEFEPEMTVKDK